MSCAILLFSSLLGWLLVSARLRNNQNRIEQNRPYLFFCLNNFWYGYNLANTLAIHFLSYVHIYISSIGVQNTARAPLYKQNTLKIKSCWYTGSYLATFNMCCTVIYVASGSCTSSNFRTSRTVDGMTLKFGSKSHDYSSHFFGQRHRQH